MGVRIMVRRVMLKHLFIVLVFSVVTATGVSASEELNVNSDGVVIEGYDPVAYFLDNKSVKGKVSITAEFEGGTYLFANQKNKETFEASPAAYAPAYGGWCSYGVRVGKKFRVDPHAWQIVDNRLFLQLDQGTQKVWLKDQAKNIEIADRLWPNIRPLPADALGN